MKKPSKYTATPYVIWAVLFTLIPLILIAVFAFTTNDGKFTISNLGAVAASWPAFSRSLGMAFVATAICLVIAYPFAYIISKKAPHTQSTMYMLAILPMWINFILRTYAWMSILEKNGLLNRLIQIVGGWFGYANIQPLEMINTRGAVILGMVYDYVPFMILPIYSILVKLDQSLIESAQDLGASPLKVFTKIILPLSMPGVSTGIIMVFVPSISTFIISQMLGGGKHEMIGDVIESRFMTSPHIGSALSLVLMVIVLIVISLINQFDDEEVGDMIK